MVRWELHIPMLEEGSDQRPGFEEVLLLAIYVGESSNSGHCIYILKSCVTMSMVI